MFRRKIRSRVTDRGKLQRKIRYNIKVIETSEINIRYRGKTYVREKETV